MSLTAVLIDDEKPSLRFLEILLKKYPDITVTGSYTSPLKALEDIEKLKPEAVFLDINMPEMMGMEAALKILDINPEADIIFATAYDQYAIEAFELHAIDYILKPVSEDRLDKTIDRLLKKHTDMPADREEKLKISCLGSLVLKWDNQEPIKWRAEKTKELFAFLLHNKDHVITKDIILDCLWPEDDPDKSIRQLYNGIYYIRKAMEEYGIGREHISIASNYNLKLGRSIDYDLNSIDEINSSLTAGNTEQLEQLSELFTGGYLESEAYPWAYAVQEEYRKLHQDCLIKLASAYIDCGDYMRAEKKLLLAYGIEPYNETVTELLLSLYLKTADKNKGIMHFRNYAGLLKEELGIKPNIKTMELYQSINLL